MAESSTRAASDTQWRRISRYLWVGRRNDHPIGMVEQGRDYVAIDADGVVRGRCRDLASAEDLLAGALPEAQDAPKPRRRRIWPVVTGAGVLVLVGAAVSAAAFIH